MEIHSTLLGRQVLLEKGIYYHNEVINYGKDEDLTEKTSKSKNNVYLIDL